MTANEPADKEILSWHLTPEEVAEMRQDLVTIREKVRVNLDRAERLLNLYTNDKAYQALLADRDELRRQLQESHEEGTK